MPDQTFYVVRVVTAAEVKNFILLSKRRLYFLYTSVINELGSVLSYI